MFFPKSRYIEYNFISLKSVVSSILDNLNTEFDVFEFIIFIFVFLCNFVKGNKFLERVLAKNSTNIRLDKSLIATNDK